VLAERVGQPSRLEHGKLVDADALDELLGRWDVSRPVPFSPNVTIDTAAVSADHAGALIVARFGLSSDGV
jgi:hypothetical protein